MNKFVIKFTLVMILIIKLCSCGGHSSANKSIDNIDLLNAYKQKSEVLLSNVAEKIEYIPLESVPNYIVDKPYTIAVNDTLIVIIAFRKIAVFERSTGKFKYEISSYGRGPNEYLYTLYNNTGYFEPDDMILVGKNLNDIIQGFSSDGTLKRTIKLPISDVDNDYLIVSPWPYREKNYLGYSINYSGVNPYKIEEFDSSGAVIKKYPNYNSFDKKKYPNSTRSLQPGCFFNFIDSVRFFEPLTDSIFSVSDNKLIPRYKINMGDAAPPYYLQGTSYMNDYEHLKYYWVSTFQESSRFLFFNTVTNFYSHLCFYDKKLKKTFLCENLSDKDYYKFEIRPPRYYNRIRTTGFINDIDGFVPVGTGFGELYINRKNEMSTYILASDIERWFKMNPEKAARLPDKLQKFSDVKATDNIIIEIVKLLK